MTASYNRFSVKKIVGEACEGRILPALRADTASLWEFDSEYLPRSLLDEPISFFLTSM